MVGAVNETGNSRNRHGLFRSMGTDLTRQGPVDSQSLRRTRSSWPAGHARGGTVTPPWSLFDVGGPRAPKTGRRRKRPSAHARGPCRRCFAGNRQSSSPARRSASAAWAMATTAWSGSTPRSISESTMTPTTPLRAVDGPRQRGSSLAIGKPEDHIDGMSPVCVTTVSQWRTRWHLPTSPEEPMSRLAPFQGW
jgi:hypothetical protein